MAGVTQLARFVDAASFEAARSWTLEDLKRWIAREQYVARNLGNEAKLKEQELNAKYWEGYANALGDVLDMIKECMEGGA